MISRVDALDLHRQRQLGEALVLLDVRRRSAFANDHPKGLAGAVPVLLDEEPVAIPDLPRDTPIVVYCACRGQASSTRVALWLEIAGFRQVRVLEGGLPAWRQHELPLGEVQMQARHVMAWQPAPELKADAERPLAERSWLQGVELPVQRNIAVLFIDMVDSTGMIERHPPRRAFVLLQTFMDAIVQVGVNHCGDIRDFEGDGAMLYFAGLGEALPAAFAIRERLNELRAKDADLPTARYSITAGPVLAGFVGTEVRRSLLFVGRPVHTAARLLKLTKPGGIVTTEDVLAVARESNPDLAGLFIPSEKPCGLKGFKKEVVTWHA